MLFWLVPLISGVGFLAIRSWQQDVALRSGELMDVREVLPEGEVDLEVRAISARRYRLELQFESTTRILGPHPRNRNRPADAPAAFPYRLRIEGLADDDQRIPLYERERDLRDLLAMASSAYEAKDKGSASEATLQHWGSVPLVEFESTTLGRMRFEFSIDPVQRGRQGTAEFEARLDKAWLVLKEDVRKVRMPAARLDFLSLDLGSQRRFE